MVSCGIVSCWVGVLVGVSCRYKNQLVSALVIDKDNHGKCVAFCLTSSECERTLLVFAHVLRQKGDDVGMEIMMSDDTMSAWNAFAKVFPTLKDHYLCQFHIQQAWRRATVGASAGSKSGYMDKSTASTQSKWHNLKLAPCKFQLYLVQLHLTQEGPHSWFGWLVGSSSP